MCVCTRHTHTRAKAKEQRLEASWRAPANICISDTNSSFLLAITNSVCIRARTRSWVWVGGCVPGALIVCVCMREKVCVCARWHGYGPLFWLNKESWRIKVRLRLCSSSTLSFQHSYQTVPYEVIQATSVNWAHVKLCAVSEYPCLLCRWK